MKKFLLLFSIICLCCSNSFGKRSSSRQKAASVSEAADGGAEERSSKVQNEFKIWQEAYPDVDFSLEYDKEKDDWALTVSHYGKSNVFYWMGGLYLPESELKNAEKYYNVISPYKNEVLDPATFTEERLKSIREFSSRENRKNGKVSSKHIFSAIYDSYDRATTESHIVKVNFLNRQVNVHEYLKKPLQRVEKKIYSARNHSASVKNFLTNLYSCSAYNWRQIRDANTRSFHSFGVAVDILPKYYTKKIVYWGWERDGGNDDWMLIPVSKRWMPPQEVIDIFLEEGFIWGGTWAIWDNMHFEYHPELTQFVK